MALVDEVQLNLRAGDGGDGVVRWRREKYVDKGGPAGGDGGRGGDIIAEAVADLAYMEFYRHKKSFAAADGGDGQKKSLEGENGEHLVLRFPRGSVITNTATGETWSLDTVGQQEVLLQGGKGGYGNEHFKASTNTTPYESTNGHPGEEGDFSIELQLFADIGLIGLPSAGKSTLLNALTNARSKVAAYHFTTLDPHLGVLPSGAVLADLPGLIEGASEGKGLGHKFLRHVKRTHMLAHLVSCENEDVAETYRQIRRELEAYDPALAQKAEIVILSKTDECQESEWQAKKTELEEASGAVVYAISAYDDDKLKQLSKDLTKHINDN